MMLGQFSWSGVGEMTVVMVPMAGVPLGLIVFYLRALRDDFKQSTAHSREAIREVHQRIDRVDERLAIANEQKVDHKTFLRITLGSQKRAKDATEEARLIRLQLAELAGKVDAQVGVVAQINTSTDRLVGVLSGGKE